jgi:hypothetical protein
MLGKEGTVVSFLQHSIISSKHGIRKRMLAFWIYLDVSLIPELIAYGTWNSSRIRTSIFLFAKYD